MVNRPNIAPEDNPQIMVADTTNGVNFPRVEKLGKMAMDYVTRPQAEAVERFRAAGYPHVRYIEDKDTDTKAIVAGNSKELIVTLRAFDSPKDQAYITPFRFTPSALGGEAGEGFHELLHANDARVLTQVANAITEFSSQLGGDVPIHFTNHSYAGAIGTAMAAEFLGNEEKYPFSRHIKTNLAFASLPPGDRFFRDALEETCGLQNIECVEIVNGNDKTAWKLPQNTPVGRRVILATDGSVIKDAGVLDNFLRQLDTGDSGVAHLETALLARLHLEVLKQEVEIVRKQAQGQVTGGENVSETESSACATASVRPRAPAL